MPIRKQDLTKLKNKIMQNVGHSIFCDHLFCTYSIIQFPLVDILTCSINIIQYFEKKDNFHENMAAVNKTLWLRRN